MTMFAKPLQAQYMKYQVCSLSETAVETSIMPKDMTLSVIVSIKNEKIIIKIFLLFINVILFRLYLLSLPLSLLFSFYFFTQNTVEFKSRKELY